MATCENCHSEGVKAKGLCTNCYMYRRRTGNDRPVELAIRHTDREIERDLVAHPQEPTWLGRRGQQWRKR